MKKVGDWLAYWINRARLLKRLSNLEVVVGNQIPCSGCALIIDKRAIALGKAHVYEDDEGRKLVECAYCHSTSAATPIRHRRRHRSQK